MTKRLFKILIINVLCIAALLHSCIVFAQKKPLTHDVYAEWKSINHRTISHQGGIAAWTTEPARGDGILSISNPATGQTQTFQRGKQAVFAADESFVIFRVTQPFDSIRKLKLKKIKVKDLPPDSLYIRSLHFDSTIKIGLLSDYKLAEKSNWLAVKKRMTESTDTTGQDTVANQSTESKKKPRKKEKQELLLISPFREAVRTFQNIEAYNIDKRGTHLAYTAENASGDSTYLSIIQIEGYQTHQLPAYKGKISSLIWDEAGKHLAFLHGSDSSMKTGVKLMIYATGTKKVIQAADSMRLQIPGYSINRHMAPWFAKNGERLFFGYSASNPKPQKDTTLLPDEKVNVDVWSWTDPKLQPQQLKELNKERKRAALAVYHLANGRVTLAGNDSITEILTGEYGNARFALGINYKPYEILQSWDDSYADHYLVNLEDGQKKFLQQKTPYRGRLSPSGRYYVWFNPVDSAWYVINTNKMISRKLSGDIPYPLVDEDHDMPSRPGSYGIVGWTTDEKYILIYDRFDIWKTDPLQKKPPVCLTSGYGREQSIQLRYIKTDPEEIYINIEKPVLLQGFNHRNKESYYLMLDSRKSPEPEILLGGPYRLGTPVRAKEADVYLYTRESFIDFPDLYIAGQSFSEPNKLTTVNPQQSEYLWGSAELLEWNSPKGRKLEGLLYKPENFDSTAQYPLIVYFYEKNAHELYYHISPRPSRSVVNPSYLVSNGYLVFIPDIIYSTGQPGADAYDCVVSGVLSLLSKGFVDGNRIGLQGQSWGGYQIAYIVTRTDMFACAMAGAPVSNMVSAYGGIRWESGRSRMFQYEKTQSRIGATLWERPIDYINNSPVFFADKINTPLLIMSNDGDGAVPWYQGIEMFTALRRLQKPCWLLNYNNEEHNLKATSWGNRMDLTRRMYQFFDHYLKGTTAPTWMTKGIPAINKGNDDGFEPEKLHIGI
jgi:dipeptidyl aminopeptidase/acylaminoacyl peptidase